MSRAQLTDKRWLVLATIGLANGLFAGLSFGLAAAGPHLRTELDIKNDALGLLLAAVPIGLMLGTYAWGVVADKVGERSTLAAAWLVVSASLAAAAASAASFALLIALLVLAGIGGSAVYSAGGRAVTQAFPVHMHGRVLSIRHTFIPLGGAFGGFAIPWIVSEHGLTSLFAASALTAFWLIIVLLTVLPKEIDREQESITASDQTEVEPPKSPLRNTNIWLLTGSGSLFALVQLGLMSFLTVLLVDSAGFSLETATTIFVAAQLAGAFGRIGLGFISDKLNNPLVVLAALALVGVLLSGAAALANERSAAIILVVLLALFTSWNGVAVAAAARLAPRGRMAATFGMQTTLNASMGVVGPIAIGFLLANAGWEIVEIAILFILLIALLGFWVLRIRSTRDSVR